jgi:VIT1/CCC1 family predicted Fe2+/Mn2+ transporter
MTARQAPGAPDTSNVQPHHGSVANKLNWLRAAVLGANDGIVSTAGIVIGVAAATVERGPVLTAGIAGLAAGALSMAVGEYVSVSTQRDTERALLETETQELTLQPDAELAELAALYEARGLSAETARQAAAELTAHNPLAAHAEIELRLDPEELTNPWLAAISSAVSFTIGALLPLIAIIVPPASMRIAITVAAVLLALGITGWVAARLGGAKPLLPILRVTVGGALAMAITFGIGHLVGATIG